MFWEVEQMRENRNYIIDLLRFLFSIMIVFHHAENLTGGYSYAPSGYLGVEFFFMVTGFYMMASVEKALSARSIDSIDVGKETRKFVSHKFFKIFPYLLVSVAVSITVLYIWGGQRDLKYMLQYSMADLFMLQMAGFPDACPIGTTWYLSAMILALLILYPLALSKKSMYINVIAPYGSLMIIGYITLTCGSVGSEPGIWLGLFSKGYMRSLAEISIGAILYYAVQKVRKKDYKTVSVVFFSILEVACYLYVAYVANRYQPSNQDLYAIAALFIGMLLTFSEKTIWYRLFNFKFFGWLGKMSMVIFMNHFYYARVINDIFPSYSSKQKILVLLVLTMITSIGVYYIVQLGKRIKEHLIKRAESPCI